MTTIHKDITNFLDEQGISYNPTRMLNLLGKLDHEDLEDLLNILDDSYKAGDEESCGYNESIRQRGYDEGYSDGYDAALGVEE